MCVDAGIVDFLTAHIRLRPAFLWAYNGRMEIVNFPERRYTAIGASGVCPHCNDKSYFKPIGAGHAEVFPSEGVARLAHAAQCESCKKFALAVGTRSVNAGHSEYGLEHFFPIGSPNDAVDTSIVEAAPSAAEDFSEAIRCHFIKAYRAAVVMCRRAIQSSAIALEASGTRLVDQIDDLLAKGKITEPLKDFAHEIRLTGNEGAHPDKDGLADVQEKDAADIIEFTREYLHHVYVLPKKLRDRKPVPTPEAKA